MIRSPHWNRILLTVLLVAVSVAARADTPRFAAMLANGQRLEGQRFHDWQQQAQMPRLDGAELMNAGNPLSWLRDRLLHPGETPGSYVEMISGDRLPCEVLEAFSGDESSQWESLPPHFVVRPTVEINPPQGQPRESIRVVERYVRRIVWQAQRGAKQYQPGTLFYKDGRTLRFRAARFSGTRVKLLQATEQTSVAFREIAQLHLPAEDPLESYYEELAVLSPTGESRLLQIDSTEGLRATGSMMQFAATSKGNAGESDNWYHGVQPAWCLEPLWTRNNRIWIRRCWSPEHVLLSHIPPSGSQSRSIIAIGQRAWRVNANTQGAALQSGGQSHGWGFGVHAHSELQFDIPKIATGFRTRVGLDEAVGSGGCVIARVFAGSTQSQPLFQSPHIVGSQAMHDTNNINLAGLEENRRRLILQIDPAHQGRPANSDPFDIRDVADWLDPTVTLDRQRLLDEVAQRIASRVPSFGGWNVEQVPDGDYKWVSDLQREGKFDGALFLPQVLARNKPLTLRRKWKVGPHDQWLMISAYRQRGNSPEPELLVRIDGIDVAAAPIPLSTGDPLPAPLAVSLAPYVGHTIDLEVVQLPTTDPGFPPVFWNALKVGPHLPHLLQVMEDEADVKDAAVPRDARVQLVDEPLHSGRASLLVRRGGKFRTGLDHPAAIRGSPKLGEQRFLRFAIRKSGQGEVRIELEHAQSRQRPAIYAAGVPALADDQFREVIWLDDEVPQGATIDGSEAGESFHWSDEQSGPVYRGELAIHRRAQGTKQQFFIVDQGWRVAAGDRLFAFVHLDPKSPPRQVMLQFLTDDGLWRRAYWGENVIPLGSDGTPERMRIGELPKPGHWTRLEVPIEKLGVAHDARVKGWALAQHDGALWCDAAGVRSPRQGPLFPATNVWQLELPEEWIVMTRDVYGDFGALDVTGVVLHVPDGEAAHVDHVYFAAKADDFNLLPQAPSPEITNQQARRELAKAVLDKGHPATVAILVDGRQATGVLVGGEGYVLTAGHVFGSPNKDCEILLPSGQRLPAKTRGICRSADLGVVHITDRKELPLPGLALHDAKEFASNQLYVGFALEPFTEETPGATAHIVSVQRDFRETMWTDFHMDQATTGGPLLDREGRIVGTQIRDSRFGGFLYAKSFVALQHWDRLKNGEVWGDWFPGAGPMLGVIISSTPEGAKVTEVIPDSPAAAADVQVGDLITRLDGGAVASLDDAYRILAAKDPGHEAAAEFTRAGQKLTKKIKLMPRVP